MRNLLKTAFRRAASGIKAVFNWVGAGPLVLAGTQLAFAGNAAPSDTIKNIACTFANNLATPALVFPVVLLVVLWAGYMIYMGKREAMDVIIKAVIATAVVLGARTIASWFATGNCT